MKKIIAIILVSVLTVISYAQNRMTPELLWDLKRISNIQVSPDNSKILFSVKVYDLRANKGSNDLYVVTYGSRWFQKVRDGLQRFPVVSNGYQWFLKVHDGSI